MEDAVKLGGRQLAVMRVLWDLGEATVAQVQKAMEVEQEKILAHS